MSIVTDTLGAIAGASFGTLGELAKNPRAKTILLSSELIKSEALALSEEDHCTQLVIESAKRAMA